MTKLFYAIALVGAVVFSSCNNEPFEIGNHLVSSPYTFGVVDTVTVRVSNLIAADSVITVGRGIGFWGAYTDPVIGSISAKTFLEFSRTSHREDNPAAVFDSVTLVLRPNGIFFGDTTGFHSNTSLNTALRIFQIERQIERGDDGLLYSTSTVPINSVPLVDMEFKMEVGDIRNNEIEIKLPNWVGQHLFQGILRDEEAYRQAYFTRTFPGLAITAGTQNNCVYGLFVNDTTCMIRVYYHVSSTFREERTMTFNVNQFNSFYHKSSEFEKLTQIPNDLNSTSAPVFSSQTGNMGIITSGSKPFFARIEFPHLNELLRLGQIVRIERAILYVRPIHYSFDIIPLPPRLNLFYLDPLSNSTMGSAIRPPAAAGGGANTGPQFGNLPEHYREIQSPDFAQYTFDVTDFIASQLGRVGHEKWALSLLIPDGERENTIQRLIFGDQNFLWHNDEGRSRENRIKLEVNYVVYND